MPFCGVILDLVSTSHKTTRMMSSVIAAIKYLIAPKGLAS